MIRIPLVFSFVLTLASSVNGQPETDVDFRTLGALPEIHLTESPRLLASLELSDPQKTELDQLVSEWKAEYLKRKQQIDALPPDDRVGRLGWPPTRDRALMAAIFGLLNDAQHERFHELLALWNWGPVRSENAFRYDGKGQLGIRPDQHRRLHDLNVQWVLAALAAIEGQFDFSGDSSTHDRRLSLPDSRKRLSGIAREAWEFKPQRDIVWEDILLPRQASRWRQLELQRQFQQVGFRMLMKGYADRNGKLLPDTGTSDDYLVPYFIFPADALQWSKQQHAQLAKLISEFDNEGEPRPQDRQELIEWYKDRTERLRRYLREVEAIMTTAQLNRWRELTGEPYGPLMKALIP